MGQRPRSFYRGDILRTMEGPLAPVACLDGEENECVRCDSCVTIRFWSGLKNVVDQYVDSFTLADFLSGDDYVI